MSTDSKAAQSLRFALLLGVLYVFLFSIGLLGSSLKLFGADLAKQLIATTAHPIVGLFIGILATSVVQSSSMTTSLIVGMVASSMLTVENAIPMVMGANIGTTITNLLVSLAHIRKSREFQRAFGAGVVHDIFNLLSVALFLPLQYATNFLGILSEDLAKVFSDVGGMTLFNPVKTVTKPVIHMLLDGINHNALAGTIIAVVLLFFSLNYMVKILKSVFIGHLTGLFERVIFKTTFRSFVVGLFITVMVQSSSITTSLVIPLAGSGVLNIIQIYPYTLGANLGTTATAILASLATGNLSAVSIAFAHMCFNLCGIAVFLPLKKIPITMATKLAEYSIRSKLIPIGFVLTVFFIIPLVLVAIWR